MLRTPSGGSEYTAFRRQLRAATPVMEALGRAEVEHDARNNRMRAL